MNPARSRPQSQPRRPGTGTSASASASAAAVAALAALLALSAAHAGAAAAPVTRSGDLLPATAASEPAFLNASCPCSGPLGGGIWRAHGQYLACVAKATRHRARTTELTAAEARRIRRDRAPTTCGSRGAGEGNVRVCGKNPVLPCPTVRTARVDDCAECDAALAGRLVRCARIRDASGGESAVCGVKPLARPGRGGILEVRSGVDCDNCREKLGTPATAAVDCLVASCGGGIGF